jgi:hypothetical protein
LETGIPIFPFEAAQDADGESGKAGEGLSVCKETLFTHPLIREKSNFLSVKKSSTPKRKKRYL